MRRVTIYYYCTGLVGTRIHPRVLNYNPMSIGDLDRLCKIVNCRQKDGSLSEAPLLMLYASVNALPYLLYMEIVMPYQF